jgi:hypothetical protein
MSEMVERKTWEEFRAAGLLWWANRILHLFGWAIVVLVEDATGKVIDAYPARVRFRDFDRASEEEGFAALTNHLAESAGQLKQEVAEQG